MDPEDYDRNESRHDAFADGASAMREFDATGLLHSCPPASQRQAETGRSKIKQKNIIWG